MKNIHLIPTDKPSRLHLIEDVLTFTNEYKNSVCDSEVNIYITSDEEIKDGWSYDRMMRTVNKIDNVYSSKIILTTDQDLIKDGVQAIDDDFLEWFVKNPSCENVEVKSFKSYSKDNYIIFIPQEEPKQENCCTPVGQIKRYVDCKGCDMKPTQKTLEEAAENHWKMQYIMALDESTKPYIIQDFISGAKFIQERMYSEAIDSFITQIKNEFKDDNLDYLEFIKARVIEQFKKK